jgi:signal transduction histidine kinase
VQGEEVEERHGVAVRVITVGGVAALPVPADERAGLAAAVLAAREAMVNAAVHAGVADLDVFAEVDGPDVVIYVRDRGRGFDLSAIPEDRHGVRGSIIGRMRRAGGRADVQSTPGRGTEVQLRIQAAPGQPAGR